MTPNFWATTNSMPGLPGGPVAPPPIPGTGGVYPRPANPYEPKDVTPNPGPGGTSPGGPTLPQPGGVNINPGPSIDGWDHLKWNAPRPDGGPNPPGTGGVYPRPGARQPEWNPRTQPSFRRPGFWQQIRQMAQPSVSTSAAGQARAQQQQSNAARARAAFLAGFNGVRRPAYQVDPYTPDGGPSYPGGSRYFDESAQYPQNAMRAY